eukprot:Em0005g663a
MSWLYTAANLAWSIVALLLRLCATAVNSGSGGKAAGNPSVKVVESSLLPALTHETLLGVPSSEGGDALDRDTSDFVKFVQTTVIPNFFRQRDKGHSEFAVLFLSKAETLSDIGQVNLLPRKPLVKRKQPFYPTVNQGHVNYIVARPDQDNHCEANLLRHLPALWSSCRRKGGYTPYARRPVHLDTAVRRLHGRHHPDSLGTPGVDSSRACQPRDRVHGSVEEDIGRGERDQQAATRGQRRSSDSS